MTTVPSDRRRLAFAWLLLTLAPLFWAGNITVVRAVHADVPPLGLVFWRWSLAALIFLPFVWPLLRDQWPVIRREARFIVTLGIIGLSGFASCMYTGLQYTTALNASFIMAMCPVVIPLVAWIGTREKITSGHAAGIFISAAGAVVIISAGDPLRLWEDGFRKGDLFVLAAMTAWSVYSVIVRRRPKDLHPNVLLFTTLVIGGVTALPLWLWELGTHPLPLTPETFAALVYIVLFPSVLAYFCFNRGIEAVGPTKGGLAMHLVPLFGAALAILFLGEVFHPYHAAGVAAIFGGIVLVTRAGNK